MRRFSVPLIGLLLVAVASLSTGALGAVATAPHPPTAVTPPPTIAPTRSAVASVTAQPTVATSPTVAPTIAPTLMPTVVPLPMPTAEPMDPPELRAVWVDAFHDGFKTPQQVDDLVAWARRANLNALFVEVRRRGDAYYLKSFEPRTEDPDLTPGFDALQYLIEKAHQGPQRLQVHAWLATLPIWWQRDTPPAAPNHAFNLHGLDAAPDQTWLMYRDDGQAWAGNDVGGIYYLDPGNPDVQAYTTEVYLNLLRNYDVDGIHLDQVRYYEGDPGRWGYNPTSVARFNAQFGRDPATQPAPDDPEWITWRRDQVTALVRRIYTDAKAIKPQIAVTAAVVTWGRGPLSASDWFKQAPYASVLQDWRTWLQQGIVDYLLPMDYYRENGEQATWFDNWTQWQVTYGGRRNVVLGLGSYLNSEDGVLSQLARARALGPMGIALYSYAVPDADLEGASTEDRLSFADELRAVFSRPAPVPLLPAASRGSMD
ncbi:MAG: family 10 glycosylhydrolase [Chloroflexi bacterium]|nr:family 10 glycosylhydrolase [Chloroflexota bacterium]